MRILLLTHAFNCLCQRVYLELSEMGHELSVEFDINDSVLIEAIELFKPNLIIAPYLKRKIPEQIWKNNTCIIIHPGIIGDKGPSALDQAILKKVPRWGVTALQANANFDEGDIWAYRYFPMRNATKSSLYRTEVTSLAAELVKEVVEKAQNKNFKPTPQADFPATTRGSLHALVTQQERKINWETDTTADIITKINSGDTSPGVLDNILNKRVFLFNACAETKLKGSPKQILATRDGAICIATLDAALWITHLQPIDLTTERKGIKRSATAILGDSLKDIAELSVSYFRDTSTYQEIYYEENNGVGYIYFDFYNGAMNTSQCKKLEQCITFAIARPVQVIALMGGQDFWSNGIHLHEIEASESPAEESLANILAMNSLVYKVITTTNKFFVSVLGGNAGAGGCFFALAADLVWAKSGIILNPHYKNMGNLFGSEYWTYLLPKKIGEGNIDFVMNRRLPLSTTQALDIKFLDAVFEGSSDEFLANIKQKLEAKALDPELDAKLCAKNEFLLKAEAVKKLAEYAAFELKKMHSNFFGFDPSYHVARHNFVKKTPLSRTPLYLATHRKHQGK